MAIIGQAPISAKPSADKMMPTRRFLIYIARKLHLQYQIYTHHVFIASPDTWWCIIELLLLLLR